MTWKRWWVWIGTGLSLVLVVVLLWRLDWMAFWKTLQTLRPGWAPGAAACMVIGIAVRALRWNLLAGIPLRHYAHFWRSANLGYLGNLIYPARAGELLRVAAVSRFAQVPAGTAIASAVMDRIADSLMLGLMLLVVVLQGTQAYGPVALIGITGVLGAVAALTAGFVLWGDQFEPLVARLLARAPNSFRDRGLRWYRHAVAVTRALRHPRHMLSVGLLTLVAFGLDYLGYWLLLAAFGWSLPALAAVAVGVFIGIGASLPSAPGYIGIYQLACVLALQRYGVHESQAVAYSVVCQLLMFLVVGIQGGWAMLNGGLRLSQPPPASPDNAL